MNDIRHETFQRHLKKKKLINFICVSVVYIAHLCNMGEWVRTLDIQHELKSTVSKLMLLRCSTERFTSEWHKKCCFFLTIKVFRRSHANSCLVTSFVNTERAFGCTFIIIVYSNQQRHSFRHTFFNYKLQSKIYGFTHFVVINYQNANTKFHTVRTLFSICKLHTFSHAFFIYRYSFFLILFLSIFSNSICNISRKYDLSHCVFVFSS